MSWNNVELSVMKLVLKMQKYANRLGKGQIDRRRHQYDIFYKTLSTKDFGP
jgi:hypothetical protein